MGSDPKQSSKVQKLFRSPIFLGILIGFLAALSQALLFSNGGPEAYGFCVACHTRDLINDVFNGIFGTNLGVASASKNAIFPSLSIIGAILGAFISAKYYHEYKFKRASWKAHLLSFTGGFMVLVCALLVGGCPYRNALRSAYGDLVAIISILAMAAGVFVGVKIILARMNRSIGKTIKTSDQSVEIGSDEKNQLEGFQ